MTDTTTEPIAGEAVTLDAVVPSPEANKADGKNRIGNTAVQTVLPGALLVIATWVAQLFHVDLDPGAGTDLPATVSGAFVSVGTILIAYAMNRGKLRGEG